MNLLFGDRSWQDLEAKLAQQFRQNPSQDQVRKFSRDPKWPIISDGFKQEMLETVFRQELARFDDYQGQKLCLLEIFIKDLGHEKTVDEVLSLANDLSMQIARSMMVSDYSKDIKEFYKQKAVNTRVIDKLFAHDHPMTDELLDFLLLDATVIVQVVNGFDVILFKDFFTKINQLLDWLGFEPLDCEQSYASILKRHWQATNTTPKTYLEYLELYEQSIGDYVTKVLRPFLEEKTKDHFTDKCFKSGEFRVNLVKEGDKDLLEFYDRSDMTLSQERMQQIFCHWGAALYNHKFRTPENQLVRLLKYL